jgi:hypothetical protein
MMYFYQHAEFLGTTKKLICVKGDDGLTWWLSDGEQDTGYIAWVAEGNEALEWVPEELSNDNQ